MEQVETAWQAICQDRTPAQVQALLRGAHTLKGAAANVDLKDLQHLAHELEDIFRTLHDPQVEITPELAGWMEQGIEGLRLGLTLALGQMQMDGESFQQRTQPALQELRRLLADHLGQDPHIFTSAELGFDLVGAVFEQEVSQEIEGLGALLEDSADVTQSLPQIRSHLETLQGIGESVGLSGFQSLTQMIRTALEQHPDQGNSILSIGIQDLQQAQHQVLNGDRSQVGQPSPQLRQWIEEPEPEDTATESMPFLDLDQLLGDKGPEISIDHSTPPPSHNPDLTRNGHQKLSSSNHPPITEHNSTTPLTRSASPTPQNAVTGTSTAGSPPPDPTVGTSVRVDVECLERLNHGIGELMLTQNRQFALDQDLEQTLKGFSTAIQQQHRLLKQIRTWAQRATQTRSPQDPKPDQLQTYATAAKQTLTQMETALGSLETLALHTHQALTQQRRLVDQCRDDLLEARMQPIAKVFQRFPRMIQTLSRSHGKPVQLHLEGTEVLVDKAVMEKLYDPLLHLLRNAFDHGIESPDQRRQQGKSPTGQIELRATQQGNRIVIEVIDDGSGIDLERIRQRALAGGWIQPHQPVSDPEVRDLIFAPNFSTATQVSDLSGRGVGLDVVKAQITALQGRITLYSQPGQGTRFLLQIPLSLTTAELMIVQVDRQTLGLLSNDILQVLHPHPHQIQIIQDQPVWKQGETLIPITGLADRLHYSRPLWTPAIAPSSVPDLTPHPLLLLQISEAEVIALEVDQILDRQEMVIRPVSPLRPAPDYLCGCTLDHEGRPMMILDPVALVHQAEITAPARPSPHPLPTAASQRSQIPAAAPAAPTVLLVEDSASMRQTVQLILVREGYTVLLARQGHEALEILKQRPDLDLILSDLDMPKINGLELLRTLRQDPGTSPIPFVLLTSQTEVQYRQLAFTLGATAYLNKPPVEAELLSVLDRLLSSPAGSPLSVAR